MDIVYVLNSGGNIYKFGKSTLEGFAKRRANLQTGNHSTLKLVAFVSTVDGYVLEAKLKKKYKLSKIKGEWFNFTDFQVQELFETLRRLDFTFS